MLAWRFTSKGLSGKAEATEQSTATVRETTLHALTGRGAAMKRRGGGESQRLGVAVVAKRGGGRRDVRQ